MSKVLIVVFSAFICLQLAGCKGWAVRTSSSTKARVDQEFCGNRGFISGKPSSAPRKPAFKERKTYRIEVEVPQWVQTRAEVAAAKEKLAAKKRAAIRRTGKDQTLWGNKGYIFGGAERKTAEKKAPVKKSAGSIIKKKLSQVFKSKPKPAATYKVRKGDTLQKISRRFYGTTKKWPLLYKANKTKLKSPDSLRPGQVLVIPKAGKSKK